MGEFLADHIPTVTTDHYQIQKIHDSDVIDVHIYDTHNPTSRRANAIIGVFSIASRDSFQKLCAFSEYFRHIREHGAVVCLVGTHADVQPAQVSDKEICKMARHVGTRAFPICVRTSKEALKPWNFLLDQYVKPISERAIPTVEPPGTPTTPKNTMITPTCKVWAKWTGSLRSCLGRRKKRSGIWF